MLGVSLELGLACLAIMVPRGVLGQVSIIWRRPLSHVLLANTPVQYEVIFGIGPLSDNVHLERVGHYFLFLIHIFLSK